MSSKYHSLKTCFNFNTHLTFLNTKKRNKWQELLVADFVPEGSFLHVQSKMQGNIKAYIFRKKAKLPT